MLGFLFKSVILHVVEKQTVVWYMLFLNSEVCKKYRFFWHNCCMFKGNYKTPKDAVFKKAFKSFIRSQYLKLKINMLLFESVFAKCIVSHAHTYMCVHTLSPLTHLCLSIVADLCFGPMCDLYRCDSD